MTRLIDADAVYKEICRIYEYEYPTASGAFDEFVSKTLKNIIYNAPIVEAIPKGAYEQVEWERDMAIQQLNDYGVQLGEKADVQAVRHGKWLKFIDNGIEYQTCSECNYDMPVGGADSWCPACGRRMDGD